MEWELAQDVKKELVRLIRDLELSHISPSRIFCYRTNGSKSRAYARIWAFPKIFQDALEIKPAYVIEVLSKYYDKLDIESKKKVLIHELLHIPKNFSGALLSHRGRNRHLQKEANKLYDKYRKLKTA
jgi:predicted metallopeptidase